MSFSFPGQKKMTFRFVWIIVLIYAAFSPKCYNCGDTSGSCGVCHVNVEPNSAFCSYHGTRTLNIYYTNFGTCHNCGGRTERVHAIKGTAGQIVQMHVILEAMG